MRTKSLVFGYSFFKHREIDQTQDNQKIESNRLTRYKDSAQGHFSSSRIFELFCQNQILALIFLEMKSENFRLQ